MSMAILGLKIKDLRNVELVDVDFKGKNFIEIRGKNGAAKSTMIDAIFTAILGKKYFGYKYPAWRVIRQDQDKALIKVTIGNRERQIEIKRSITRRDAGDKIQSGGSLTVTDTDGKHIDQKFLDNLINEFTVDPISFSKKNAKDQIELVKKLGGIDTRPIEVERKELFDERTLINREVKRLEALTREVPEKVPEIDIKELYAEKENANIINNLYYEKSSELNFLKDRQDLLVTNIKDMEKQINYLKDQLQEKIKQVESKKNNYETLKEQISRFELPEKVDTEQIDNKIKQAQTLEKRAEKYKVYEDFLKQLENKRTAADNLTDKIKACDKKKVEMIENSKLPFKNIDFSEDAGILIDGIPFSQKSQAEQIRISTRIGMELTPELKVICIKDGANLDQESFEVIKALAEKHDYQILIEKVGEQIGENTIVLRAGKVISEFEESKTIKEKINEMEDRV